MRFWYKKWVKLCVYLTFLGLVFLAVISNFARFYLPEISHQHREFLQQWVSSALHRPVIIDRIELKWHGITPTVALDGVEIKSTKPKGAHLQVNHMLVSLRVFSSLFHWKLTPGRVVLDGIDVSIAHPKGIEDNQNALLKYSLSRFMEVGIWLAHVSTIDIRHLNINWEWPTGHFQRWRDISISVHAWHHQPKIVFTADLQQMTPTRLQCVVLFKRWDEHRIYDADMFLQASQFNLYSWQNILNLSSYHGFSLAGGDLDGRFWVSWRDQRVARVQSDVTLKHLGLLQNNKQVLLQPFLAFHGAWDRLASGFSLKVDRVQLKPYDSLRPHASIGLLYKNSEVKHFLVVGSQLNIGVFSRLAQDYKGLPMSLREWLSHVHPKGLIKKISLSFMLNHNQLLLDSAEASFSDGVMRAYKSTPGVERLRGHVIYRPDAFDIFLNSYHGVLNIKQIFHHPLHFDQLKTQIFYRKNQQMTQWYVPSMQVQLPSIKWRMRASSYQGVHDPSPIVDCLADFEVNDVSKVAPLIPDYHLSDGLQKWLKQAFISGSLGSGTMIFRGPMNDFPFNDHRGIFEVKGTVRDLTLNYDKNWPNIQHLSGEMLFKNQSLHMVANHVSVNGMTAKNATASIKNLHHADLVVDVSGVGDLSQGLGFLKSTPLSIGQKLLPLQAKGPMSLKLHLNLPIEHHMNGSQVKGDLETGNGQLTIPEWALMFTHLKGALHFNNNGIWSKKLQGRFLNHSIHCSVKTNKNAFNQSKTLIQMNGYASILSLKKIVPMTIFHFIQGGANYKARFDISPSGNDLSVASQLKGVEVDLPSVYAKKTLDQKPFLFDMHFSSSSPIRNISAKYGDDFYIHARTIDKNKSRGRGFSGLILLGKYVGKNVKIPESGLDVWADWLFVNATAWQNFLDKYLEEDKKNQGSQDQITLNSIFVHAKHWLILGLKFGQMQMRINPLKSYYSIIVDGDQVKGRMKVPFDLAQQPLLAHFDQLVLNRSEMVPSKKEPNPSEWPSLNIQCQACQFNQGYYNQLTLHTTHKKNGLTIDVLRWQNQYQASDLAGDWYQLADKQNAHLKGVVTFISAGDWLKSHKLSNLLGSGSGPLSFDILVPGGLVKPNWSQVSGYANFSLKKGRIMTLSDGMSSELGLGRILALFSLQSLPKRLTLNFNDLWKEGFAFNHFNVNMHLDNGQAFLSKVDIDGPVAQLNFNGVIDYIKKTCQLKMTLSPYLTRSVPFVATLIGGPVAGVVSWFANQALKPGLKKAIQMTYHIDGSLDHPVVTKVFSDSAPPFRS